MPIDWEQLKGPMTDLALEHICRRCKKIIPGAHYRIAGEDGNYHIECYKQEDNDAQTTG
jgi:hypothetical protein